jgi:hypothetical protein
MRWRSVGVGGPGAKHGIVWIGSCCAFLGQSDVGVCFLSASVVVGGFRYLSGFHSQEAGHRRQEEVMAQEAQVSCLSQSG